MKNAGITIKKVWSIYQFALVILIAGILFACAADEDSNPLPCEKPDLTGIPDDQIVNMTDFVSDSQVISPVSFTWNSEDNGEFPMRVLQIYRDGSLVDPDTEHTARCPAIEYELDPGTYEVKLWVPGESSPETSLWIEVDEPSDDCFPDGPGTPEITFTYIPPIGSDDDLEGRVRHVESSSYGVSVYIYVNGWGWWTKPYWNDPVTTINCNGSFVTDITTGGLDPTATRIAAFLIPNDYDPPRMDGGGTLPNELYQNSVADIIVDR